MITGEPYATPVTTPVVASTVAKEGDPLLHVPPVAVSASVVVPLIQTEVVPVMAGTTGAAITVNIVVAAVLPHELVTV